MTNPYRDMCSDLIDALDSGIPAGRIRLSPLADLARALLGQPQPPVAGEVAASLIELRSTVMGLGQMGMHVAAKRVERAADLLQRQHPQPVAVSKRPWERKGWCDEQGRCWVFDDQLGLPSWTLIRVQGEILALDMYWLPANALPLPQAHGS